MGNKPAYYSILPANIRYDNTLTSGEKILFSEISALTNKYGYCIATNEYFADLYGMHKNAVSRMISKLEKKNYIRTYLYENNKRKIYISTVDTINKIVNRAKQRCLDGNNKYNKKVSKDTLYVNSSRKSKKKKRPAYTPKQPINTNTDKKTEHNKLVEYWNGFKHTPHHNNPNTKVYQQSVKYLNMLKKGLVGKKLNISEEWLNEQGIPIKWLDKKYSDPDIRKMLANTALLFTPGNWPENKNRLPKTLPALIFNPVSSKSLLFLCKKNQPAVLSKTNIKTGMDKKTIKMFNELIGCISIIKGSEYVEREMYNIKRWMEELIQYFKNIPSGKLNEVKSILPNVNTLLDEYMKFILNVSWNNKAVNFGIHSNLFKLFIDAFSENIGIDLRTGKYID